MGDTNFINEIAQNVEECNRAIFQIDPNMLSQDEFNEVVQQTLDPDSLTANECDVIALRITQHAYCAQFRVNRVKAIIDYLSDKIRMTVAKQIPQYKGVSWEYAEALAIKNDSAACEMHEQVREYKLIYNSTKNQVDILRELSRKIDGIKYGKKL